MKSLSILIVALIFSLKSFAQAPESTLDEVGPHHRLHADASGQWQPGQRIVSVGTGMNYWDGQKWAPSDPTFDPIQGAFVADRLHFKVRLEENLNQIGAVTVITPEGTELRSTPVGIGLYDTATGESAIIAAVADCLGVQVADDVVVYENAFKGVCADVVYRVDRGTFEQDVVITGKLNPSDFGFDPATAQIQIFTEFYGAPQPEIVRRPIRIEQRREVRNRLVSPDLIDELLGFGEFVIGTGRAFTVASDAQSGAPVAKGFKTVLTRTFLIETLDHSMIQREMEALPDCEVETASVGNVRRTKDYAGIPKAGSGLQAKATGRAKRVARADLPKRSGVVIDYLATIGGTLGGTTVFKGDTTYFLTNAVTCNGAVTIEGGAVFKYPTTSTNFLKLTSTVSCKTSSYRPAIFTAGDDDTVGDKISTNIWAGYTGVINTNGYGNPALWLYFNAPTLSNLRFRYCQEAIRFEGSLATLGTLNHSQLANCIRGIVINGSAGTCTPNLAVNNSLIANVQYPIKIAINSFAGTFHHLTVDTASCLLTSTNASGSSASYKNSVFANITTLHSGTVTNSGNNNGFYLATTFGTSQLSASNYPFQSVGAGHRYLASVSSFRNAGTTSGISILNDLKKRTTYPPLILTNTITTATTLSPQAPRDTDLPDLGYHYDPIDYAVNTLTVTNATLTLTNGVALATFGNTGVWLQDGSQLYSEGKPLQRNHLARFFNVQEDPTNWGGGTLTSMVTVNPYNTGASPPAAQLRFTDFDAMANSGYHLYTSNALWTLSSLLLQDCSLNSALFYLNGPTNSSLSLNNNLFEHITATCNNAPQISFYNNLYRYGFLYVTNASANSNNWTFKDNAFDSVITLTNTGTALTASYNAYIAMGTYRFYPTNANDKVLTGFTYASSTLGGFYQSTSTLYDAGSRNATNAGLYHYTVKASQVKETNSVVDIGFHYVAVTSGVPFDTDGDGTPDYLEDRNGDGNGANDLNDWQTYNSPYGLTGNPGLQVFTPLK